jgi:hypothetical protein
MAMLLISQLPLKIMTLADIAMMLICQAGRTGEVTSIMVVQVLGEVSARKSPGRALKSFTEELSCQICTSSQVQHVRERLRSFFMPTCQRGT